MLTTLEPRPLANAVVDPSPFNLPPIIKDLAKHIAKAADTAIEAYVAERITDEPNIADRWIGAVEQALSSGLRWRRRKGAAVCWQAKTLRASSGRAGEERRFGADLLGVAEIHVGDQCIHEGFLGQAKRVEPDKPMNSAEWRRLQEQTERMLDFSPASFVLAYSKTHGIRFLPAIAVAGFQQRDLFDFNSIPLRQFFEWHLAGYLGDRRLSAPHISTLQDGIGYDSPEEGSSPPLEYSPARRGLHIRVNYETP